MQWLSRAGGEPDLGVAEALADLTEHGVGRQAQVLQLDYAMAAGEARIHRVERALDADAGFGKIGHEQRGVAMHWAAFVLGHDDGAAGTLGAGDQPLAGR